METKHYVRYFLPGSFFEEEEIKELKNFDVSDPEGHKEAQELLPKRAFAYSFYDVDIIPGVLENGEKTEERRVHEFPTRFYPGGRIYSLKEIENECGKDSILAGNIRYNKIPKAVKTRMGNWQFVTENTVVLD